MKIVISCLTAPAIGLALEATVPILSSYSTYNAALVREGADLSSQQDRMNFGPAENLTSVNTDCF